MDSRNNICKIRSYRQLHIRHEALYSAVMLGYSIFFFFVHNYLQNYISPLPSYTTIFIQSARLASIVHLRSPKWSIAMYVQLYKIYASTIYASLARGKTPSKNRISNVALRLRDYYYYIQGDSVLDLVYIVRRSNLSLREQRCFIISRQYSRKNAGARSERLSHLTTPGVAKVRLLMYTSNRLRSWTKTMQFV